MKKTKGHTPEDYEVMENMGKFLKRRRQEKKQLEGGKWTQPSLGKRVGVSSQMIGYIEGGKKWPGPALLVNLLQELEVNPGDVLRRRDFRSPKEDGNRAKVSGE